MAKKILHQWECPKHFLLKLETILLAVFVFLVFLFSFATFNQQWLPSIIATLFFLVVFFLVNHASKAIYPIKENYQLTHQGITIEKKIKDRLERYFIKYSNIKQFKLDKFVHGGRIDTKDHKHFPIFFNTLKEINKLEKVLKNKLKI